MASPTDSMSRCHTKDGAMSSNTNSPTAPMPSHLDSHSSPPVKDPNPNHSHVNRPPSGPIIERSEPHQSQISQEVLQGLHLLGLDMPPGVTAKVVTTYTNMLPMERFLVETCNVDGRVHAQDYTGGARTLSCQANMGSSKSG